MVEFYGIDKDQNANADGTASWARIINGGDVFVADMDVSDLDGSGGLKMNTTDIAMSGTIEIVEAKIIAGNA